MADRICLKQISPDAFVSPTDRAALQNLQRVPVLPILVQKFNEFAVDRLWYVMNSAESVRCGPSQFPTLYHLLREACWALDVPQPELYVQTGREQNAYTAGVNRTFIVVNSELVERFSDEELLFVLGHELGHVKCGHVLYQMLARFLLPLLDAVGQATLGVGKIASYGLVSAFYEWMRQAEFTCDRAGLLVCQDPEIAFRTTMKIGSGGGRLDAEMNVDAFLEQARHHVEAEGFEAVAKALLFFFYSWQLTHPQVVFRARGLDEWIRSGAYDRVLGGDYTRDAGATRWVDPCPGVPRGPRPAPRPESSARTRATDSHQPAAPRSPDTETPPDPLPTDPMEADPIPTFSGLVLCPQCGALASSAVARCRECGAELPEEEGM